VARAQFIGRVGSSGRSTGPHLHYEIRINDEPVNPLQYLLTSVVK
jgi:murein DD-endopeptidase MepM/ murein hydrolase activator NlpD